jgi:hypothetical protein
MAGEGTSPVQDSIVHYSLGVYRTKATTRTLRRNYENSTVPTTWLQVSLEYIIMRRMLMSGSGRDARGPLTVSLWNVAEVCYALGVSFRRSCERLPAVYVGPPHRITPHWHAWHRTAWKYTIILHMPMHACFDQCRRLLRSSRVAVITSPGTAPS